MDSRFSRSPMCGLRIAKRSLVRQKVCFNSPPQASTSGSGRPRSMGVGTNPRARRTTRSSPRNHRTTESSARVKISRSWRRSASTRGPNRSTASSLRAMMGSSLQLPLVITRISRPSRKRSSCRGVYGSITPRYRFPGATRGERSEGSSRRERRQMGFRTVCRIPSSAGVRRANLLVAGRSRHMTANGLLLLRFFSRSRATASWQVASHAIWNPPSPRSATTLPSFSSSRVRRSGSSCPEISGNVPSATGEETRRNRGPQSGQAMGWA